LKLGTKVFSGYYPSVDHFQNEFLIEIEELVEQIFLDVEALRNEAADSRARREQIDKMFRHVHSVKGSAGSSGLEVVSQIAHEFETLLDEIRSGRVVIDTAVTDVCESATEALQESLNLAASGVVEPSRGALFDKLRAAANNQVETADDSGREAILASIPSAIWQSLTDFEKQRLSLIVAERSPLFLVSAVFEVASFDSDYSRLQERLAQHGEIVSTSPAVAEEQPEKINFRLLYASQTPREQIDQAINSFANIAITSVSPAVSRDLAKPPHQRVSATLSNFVRADLDKLDRLISSTHELLRTTSSALDLALSQQPTGANQQLAKLNTDIRSSFIRLEDDLINLRMVSLGATLQRAVRAGKTAARASGKEVNFEVSGADIRLDKLLAEALADPLIHLVRNAVDHGIETPAERESAGKNPRGTVRLEGISEGSQTRVRVMDDGRGVDPDTVFAAAARLGITHEPQLNIEGSLRLIFRAGFTTIAEASGVSGRGVGLDIVETAIEQVGGELRVSSAPGRGSTFEIRLPVTFGVVAANVVVSNGHRYCIPANQTLGIDAIDVIDGTSAADQLRQVSMRDLLGQPEAADADETNQLHLITCQFKTDRAGDSDETRRIGIVVDQVDGPQEVLVRSLGRHAGRWYGIAGAAELNDGTVSLVLDLPRLLA
jgi:two-component system chemotaxis sensor kinase CheA